MNFGFAYVGYQGDHRPVSSPDGGSTSMWPILRAFQEAGWRTYLMHEDLDRTCYDRMGDKLFTGPCAQKRLQTYRSTIKQHDPAWPMTKGMYKVRELPELDILLMEWRWIIPEKTQPYLARQRELLARYGETSTKILIYDTDHKLTAEDELCLPSNAIIVEPSFRPRFLTRSRRTLHYATDIALLVAGRDCINDITKHDNLCYVGNRYERDQEVRDWLHPISKDVRISIVGKWEPIDHVRTMWPDIRFESRLNAAEFKNWIAMADAVPLLAKKSYHETGLMALRVFEAVMNGTLPISLSTFTGAHLITARVAESAEHLREHCRKITSLSTTQAYLDEHMRAVEMLEQFDYRRFVDRVLAL